LNKKHGRNRQGRRRKKKGKTDLETVMEEFVACGRCSFFLAGYRVLHGTEALEQAAQDSDDQWLTLKWDSETRRLVQSSYGSRLDIDFYYFDGRCPECQRRYVIGEEVLEPDVDQEGADQEQQEQTGAAPEPSTLRMALTFD
jgi:hypothetical protein